MTKLEKRAEKLQKELDQVRRKINNKKRVGYRAVFPGDEYDYGTYINYLFEDYGAKEALRRATSAAEQDHGYVESIYKGKENPG